jgi:beta-lactamase class A
MIKPYVALAYFSKVEDDKFTYTARDKRNMVAMLKNSSNPSTDYFIRKLGGPNATLKILKKKFPSLSDRVEIVEYIGRGKTYRNKATAASYSQLLNNGGHSYMFKGSFADREDIDIINKTGTTRHVIGDIAVFDDNVNSGNDGVIVVGIIEDPRSRANLMSRLGNARAVLRHVATLAVDVYKRRTSGSYDPPNAKEQPAR